MRRERFLCEHMRKSLASRGDKARALHGHLAEDGPEREQRSRKPGVVLNRDVAG